MDVKARAISWWPPKHSRMDRFASLMGSSVQAARSPLTLVATRTGQALTQLSAIIKKLLPILLVASAGIYFLTGRVLEADEATPAVRSFVAANERILSEVGAVQEVKVTKRVSVSATSPSGAYRLYTVDIRGATNSITAVIRLHGGDGGGVATVETIIR